MRFKRGDGPLVSVLMPTRGRVPWLAETVDSLYSLARDKSLIEFCFKLDQDDLDSIKFIQDLSAIIPARTIISPRGKGYLELHNFINELSAIAKGDWLFIFNDDARMLTEGWEQILLEADPWLMGKWGGNNDVCLFAPRVVEREISWEFPILRRKVYEILGHFSLAYSSDAYIYGILSDLDAAAILSSIEVTHFINEIDDKIKQEGSASANNQENLQSLVSKEVDALKEIDRGKLRTYLENK